MLKWGTSLWKHLVGRLKGSDGLSSSHWASWLRLFPRKGMHTHPAIHMMGDGIHQTGAAFHCSMVQVWCSCAHCRRLVVDRGQHGHSEIYTSPYIASCNALCVLTSFYHRQQLVLQQVFCGIGPDRLAFALSQVHCLSFLGPRLVDTNPCTMGTPHKTCRFDPVV